MIISKLMFYFFTSEWGKTMIVNCKYIYSYIEKIIF